jgi:UDP-GlcNAc:undecaprenyl-phosphate/decaprenyl-phosphate GlcNAc-1-phosphate transferase
MNELLLLGGVLSFLLSFYTIPKIIKLASEKKLYDVPNERKIHTTPIPSLGGIGIFVGFFTGFLFFANTSTGTPILEIALALMLTFLFGVKDDVGGITPLKKFVGQILVASILVFKGNLVINNMHGFLGITNISGVFSQVFTLFTIAVIMNAYNLIDGVDGLAATVSMISATTFGIYFVANNNFNMALLSFTFLGGVAAFYVYNRNPAKIFMGDTGSMLCGVVNAILCIRFIEKSEIATTFVTSAAPAIAFSIVIMPLLDTLRVFTIRIANGRSPFFPDRTHLHHLLLDRGFTHNQICLTIGSAGIFFIGFSYFAQPLGTTFLLVSQMALFFIGVFVIQVFKEVKNVSKQQEESDAVNVHVSFTQRLKNATSIVSEKNQRSYNN